VKFGETGIAVGVPEIAPDVVFKVMPAGSAGAMEYDTTAPEPAALVGEAELIGDLTITVRDG
jgi:hypothetical protein